MPEIYTDISFNLLIGIAAVCVAVFVLIGGVLVFNDFSRELNNLNNEIKRTQGTEREYWIRRKRKLWLSLLPFIKY